MWALRMLSGGANQIGQIFPLKKGKNVLGRTPNCDVHIFNSGVSKQHAEITVMKDKIMIVDLNSSNGTFVNGVRIQNGMLHRGDKISLFDTIFDLILAPQITTDIHQPTPQNRPPRMPIADAPAPAPMMMQQNTEALSQPAPQTPAEPAKPPKSIRRYLDTVVLPGIYRLAEFTEFRYVLGGFVFLFVLMVTILSTIPMIQITRSSIEQESRRRALTIARNLATLNQQALVQGTEAALTTQNAEVEEGVSSALIVAQTDGSVLAPAAKAGSVPDLPFVHTARRENREVVSQIDSSTIGASVPISYYSSELGSFTVKAHAIVLYNMGSLAVDEGRTISLFIQTFVIASIVGALLFFFMYKLISHPIVTLNEQLDTALKEKNDGLQVSFRFPEIQALASNINSLLSRLIHGDMSQNNSGQFMQNKDAEADNVLQLIGYPAVAINKDIMIISANSSFEALTGAGLSLIQNQNLSALPDQALQKNIGDLLDRAKANTQKISVNQLDFSGENYILSCQAITNTAGEVEYYLVTISPVVESVGGAA